MTVVDSLRKPWLDKVLSLRDKTGAVLAPVFLVTRTWSGTDPGDGVMTEERRELRPSPRIVDYSHSTRLLEGGAVRQGDLILKAISKVTYPDRATIDGSSTAHNVEKFYDIGGELHLVISVTQKHLWWNVQVRRVSAQTRPA
jgi:hypothetical protein